MSLLEILKSILFGIIQGITEWLPVSSTGHLIILRRFVDFELTEGFFDVFKVVIQLGSVLAVAVLYFNTLWPFSRGKSASEKRSVWMLWLKIIIASVPAGIAGFLLEDTVDSVLSSPFVIAAALVVYGVIFLWIDKLGKKQVYTSASAITPKTALFIGFFQMLALIPGTSRSGSTIIGAMLLGTTRPAAAEFSFFMALPVMAGAGGLKLLTGTDGFGASEWITLAAGTVTAFAVSLFAIGFLVSYVKKHDFRLFGWYRIALGLIVAAYFTFAR